MNDFRQGLPSILTQAGFTVEVLEISRRGPVIDEIWVGPSSILFVFSR